MNKIKLRSFQSLILLLFVVLFAGNVLALGITPGKTNFEFESGSVKEVSFKVVNSEHIDMDLIVLIRGDLNKSIAVSDVSFKMSADESEKEFTYFFTMPDELKPGSHFGEVVVVQLPGKSGISEAYVGAALGVATKVQVNVPYPGQYAEASLDIIGPDNGEITFVIPVVSRGDLDLPRVKAVIDIYSPTNEKLATINTNEVSIPSLKRKEVVAKWPIEVPSGTYNAVATVIYGEKTLKLEKNFNVGERVLSLSQIEVNDFNLGDIAKFEMLVENGWSETITGAYAHMNIYNDEGAVMADFKSQTYDIPSLEKILMVSFWDTEGVRKGKYDASVFLRYGQSSEQQEFELEVLNNQINIIGVGYVISSEGSGGGMGNSLIVVLIVAIVVLILINVLWFLVLRKKVKK